MENLRYAFTQNMELSELILKMKLQTQVQTRNVFLEKNYVENTVLWLDSV